MSNVRQRAQDMAAVHGFYLSLLTKRLGHTLPLPSNVKAAADLNSSRAEDITALEEWLSLLDFAISPVMVRDALGESTQEDAEALLRHLYRKQTLEDSGRDKADYVATFLYRASSIPVRSVDHFTSENANAFEEQLFNILQLDPETPLPEEHRQLLREFASIFHEIDEFQDFDKLMDSGLLARVRDIKERFGASFYHPRVLSIVAEYNVFIGRRFDELFREAARRIKGFASKVQEMGGSIMERVEGDVTVKQLTEVEEQSLLRKEYSRAQEHLRAVSKFKKAVDKRSKSLNQHRTSASAHATAAANSSGAAARVARLGDPHELGFRIDRALEDGKLRAMMETIRNFVLAAHPKSANVVPMRAFNLALAQAEVDAFRAEYRDEQTFRGNYVSVIAQAVSVNARMMTEMEELKTQRNSAYLWKPIADSLTYLLGCAKQVQDASAAVLKTAEQRGLKDKATAIEASLQRLQITSMQVARALEQVGAGAVAAAQ